MWPLYVLPGLHYPLAPLCEGPVICVSLVNITMATEAQRKQRLHLPYLCLFCSQLQ